MDQIVNDLIELRKAKKFSQRYIAKELGVSYTTIQDIEKRERGIWFDYVIRWVEACGVDPVLWISRYLEPEGRKVLERDRRLVRQFLQALRIPGHRSVIEALSSGWPDDAVARSGPSKRRRAL